jgi:hypothetical protein
MTRSMDTKEWDKALPLYRERLRFYLASLIQCECREGILAKVESEGSRIAALTESNLQCTVEQF